MFQDKPNKPNNRPLLIGLGLGGAAALALLTAIPFLSEPSASPACSATPPATLSQPSAAAVTADWAARIAQTSGTHFADLMNEILALPDEEQRTALASELATRWMAMDLDGYLSFLDQLDIDDRLGELGSALRLSFERFAGKQALRGKIRYVADRISEQYAEGDPRAGVAWAREWLSGGDQDAALAKLAVAMVEVNPAEAGQIFTTIQAQISRLEAATELSSAWAEKDPEGAMAWAKTVSKNTERTLAMAGVAAVLARTEPERAAQEVADFQSRIQGEYSAQRERDRVAAGIKAESDFGSSEEYNVYLEEMEISIGQKDTPEGDFMLSATETVGYHLSAKDPHAALRWAQSLPIGLAQAYGINGALAGWASTAPQEAVGHYVQNYGSDPGLATRIYETWTQTDPAAATTGLSLLRTADQRSAAIEGIVSGWSDSDGTEQELVAWVDTLPAGADRERANAAVVSTLTDTQPAAAWDRALKLSEPNVRRRALRDTFLVLAHENPTLARTKLASYQGKAEEIAALKLMLND